MQRQSTLRAVGSLISLIFNNLIKIFKICKKKKSQTAQNANNNSPKSSVVGIRTGDVLSGQKDV